MNEEQRKAALLETFNTVSGDYDHRVLRFFPESARHLASLLKLRGDEHVLDVATGTGHAALELAARLPRGQVTGVDFSAGMLAQARQKAAARGAANVVFLEMDMQALRFSKPFDAATCAFGIFFVDDMEAELTHIAAQVRPGGTVAICNFQKDYFSPLRDLLIQRLTTRYPIQLPPPVWERIATEAGCHELFAKAGLRDIQTESKNMGYFLADENEWWDVIWNAGFRRMVSQLAPADLARFQKEHLQEVAALKTPAGLWLDIGVLYTVGRK